MVGSGVPMVGLGVEMVGPGVPMVGPRVQMVGPGFQWLAQGFQWLAQAINLTFLSCLPVVVLIWYVCFTRHLCTKTLKQPCTSTIG